MNPSKLANPDAVAITNKINSVKRLEKPPFLLLYLSSRHNPAVQIYTAGNAIAIAKQVNTYFISSDAPRILVSDYRSWALFDYNKGSKAALGLDRKLEWASLD